MPIENLPALSDIDDLSLSDALALDSFNAGGDARVSLTLLAQFLLTAGGFPLPMEPQYVSPAADDFTVTVAPSSAGRSVWLLLTPTADFATGEIALPAAAECVEGQEVQCNCDHAITALSVTSDGATLVSMPTTLAADSHFLARFSFGLQTWFRI